MTRSVGTIQRVFLLALMILSSVAVAEDSDPHWFDGRRKVKLWRLEYSGEYRSHIYAESPHPKARKQVLTGRIIVRFAKEPSNGQLVEFQRIHGITVMNKLPVGNNYYMFMADNIEASLNIANGIAGKDGVVSAYPDWLYLK